MYIYIYIYIYIFICTYIYIYIYIHIYISRERTCFENRERRRPPPESFGFLVAVSGFYAMSAPIRGVITTSPYIHVMKCEMSVYARDAA